MTKHSINPSSEQNASRNHSSFSNWRKIWILPVVAVIAGMAMLAQKVIVPATNDPESSLYNSSLGYPSQQRLAGKPIKVKVAQLSDESLTDFVAAAGETVALVDVEVCCQLTGEVRAVPVEEGQYVTAGQTLVELDPGPWEDALSRKRAEMEISRLNIDYYPALHSVEQAELEAKVKRAQKHLTIVQGRLGRYESLRKEAAASAEEIAIIEELLATREWELASAEKEMKQHLLDAVKEVEEAKQTLAINEAIVREAERDLKYTTIKAPCSGLVARLSVQPGELLQENGEVAVRLADRTVFKAYIDQSRVDAVQPGDSATVRMVAEPGRTYQGTVIRVNPSVDTQGQATARGRVDTRFTYSAWIELDQGDLPAGLQGNVEFRKEVALSMIPESSVIHLSSGEGMVMVVRNGRTAINRVELGLTHGPLREVKSGLRVGDQVVLNPMGLEVNDLVDAIQTNSRPKTAARPQRGS